MGSKRTLILVAAVLVGALAAYSLYTYVNGVEDRAYDHAALVEVYVVKGNLPANTKAEDAISQKLVAKSEIPQEFRPDNAITDLSVLSGKVAQVDLSANQVLVSGMFADAGKVYGSFSERIPAGEVAVSLPIDTIHGVGGWLATSDLVNLMVYVSGTDGQAAAGSQDSSTGGTASTPADAQVDYLYQNAKILAIGRSTDVSSASSDSNVQGDAGIITFSVTPEAAQHLVLASKTGDIYLALAPKDYTPKPLPPVDQAQLFDTPLTPSADVSTGAAA